MIYHHTFKDGGLVYETVSNPAPSYDEYAETIVYQAFAYCTSLPADLNGRYPIYRVTWHPVNDWDTLQERQRCNWDSPSRIEKADGYYLRSSRQLFLPEVQDW